MIQRLPFSDQIIIKMKINFGISIAIAYLVFVGGMVTFAVVASNQKNDLVTENYYNEAVAYQDRIEAVKNAKATGTDLQVSFHIPDHSIRVRQSENSKSISGEIYFYRPDNAGSDFHVPFTINTREEILKLNHKMTLGFWKAKAQWMEDSLLCISENKIFVQ
jgi:nitrogen fixation protein FixH